MRSIVIFVLFLFPLLCNAGGRTAWAVPSQIDIERGGGFMVYGAFGNPAGCTKSDRFYIRITHPQYDKIYATVLAAFSSKQKIRAYIHNCSEVSWYSGPETTYNVLEPYGDLNVKN